MMRKVVFLAALALCASTSAWAQVDADTDGPPVWPVEVTNFPESQAVTGAVSVDNFPAVQEVTGAVEVSNLTDLSLGPPVFQLVGFTTALKAGASGWLAFNATCGAEFTGSRMCTSQEILDTVDVPTLPASGDAWVRPVRVAGTAWDVSGVTIPTPVNCNGAGTGVAVDSLGRFHTTTDCGNVFLPVACCAPVAE